MKHKVYKIIFLIGTPLALGIIGMFCGRYLIGTNAGLAAATEVLLYGLAGLVIGVILAFFLRNRIPDKYLIWIDLVYLVLIAWLIYMIYQIQKDPAPPADSDLVPTPVRQKDPAGIPDPDVLAEVKLDRKIGIGVSRAIMNMQSVIELYAQPDGDQKGQISFAMGPSGMIIDKKPANFNPLHFDKASNILLFKTIAQEGNYFEIIIDKATGTSRWVAKADLRFLPWSEFLFTVHSVNPVDISQNPIRLRPEENAPRSVNYKEEYILKPEIIQSEWMKVTVLNDAYQQVGTGYLKWRDDNGLLIEYHLQS